MEETDVKQKLGELIEGIRYAMLTTVAEDGALHARPMYTQEQQFDGDLWFFTSQSTHKVQEIERDHHVNVAYSDPDKNRFVSVAGVARLVRDLDKAKELWSPAMKAWFPEGVESPDLVLLKVTPRSAEFWDSSSKSMVKLFGFAKAVLTGKRYEGRDEENDRIDLQSHQVPPSVH